MPLSESLAWVDADRHREQGEYVLLIAPPVTTDEPESDDDDSWVTTEARAWIGALLQTHSVRDVAKLMTKALGRPRDQCYSWLLRQPSPTKGDRGQNAQ